MAYGFSISPVQLALRDLASTVGEGFSGIGKQRLQSEESALKRTMLEHNMAREAKMDELRLPGLQQEAEKAKQEMALDNEPVTIGGMAGDLRGVQFFTNVPKGMERSPAEDIAGVFGAKIDTKEGSPTRGMLVKSDGTLVLWKDIRGKANVVSAILLAHSDVYHIHEDQLSRQDERFSQNPELMKTPEGKKLMANMKNTVAWLDNPELQLKTLVNQRKMLERFQGQSPIFDKNLDRIDKQIEKVEGRISKAAEEKREQAFRLKLQDREFAVKKEIAEMGETREDKRAAIAAMGKRVDALRDQNKEIEKTIRTYEENKALASDDEKKVLDAKITDLRGEVKLNLAEINTIAKELTGEKEKGAQRDPKQGERYVVDEGVGKSGKRYVRYNDGSIEEVQAKKEPTKQEKEAALAKAKEKAEKSGRPLTHLKEGKEASQDGLATLTTRETQEEKRRRQSKRGKGDDPLRQMGKGLKWVAGRLTGEGKRKPWDER